MADVIVGTNLPTYIPTSLEVGKTIYCRVRAANVAGFAFRNSAPTGAVAPAVGGPVAPSILTPPNIADLTPEVGETLHTTDGSWGGVPAPTFSYQWHRVTVGAPAAPLNTDAPEILDLTPEVGETLHTTDGTWSGEPTPVLSYQWHRVTVAVGVPPSGGVPNIADTTPEVGETLHVTDGTWAGDPTITFGYQWHRVTADPVAPSGGTPSIADTTPVESETLHCDHGTWAGDTPITYAYQWKRGAASVGTDSADYLLGSGDVTFSMSCVVTASNVAGSSSPATSNVVGPVTALPVAPSNTGAPSIADITPEVDETLHVTDGTWIGTPAPTFGYQWFQVGTAATITSSATATNVENTVLAHALTADQTVTWSLRSSPDQGRFELSGSTLRWLSNGTKNFEAPNDADLNNAYVVVVRATATTGQTTDQTVTVTVTNVADTTLTFNFMADTSTIAGAASTSTGPLTVTRAGAAFFAERLDGVWTSFGANVARRTDRGLLIEESRANVVLRNRDFTNASWVKTSCTALKDQTGIDGVASAASKLTATGANATCLLTCSIASSARFHTAFIKRITGTGNIQMTMDNGTTWTTVTITSSWARYSIPTQTLANPVVGFRIVTSGDVIAVDFVQNENGLYATSPIPTTTATVTRAADVIVINTAVAPIASWINETVGTLYAEGVPYVGTLATSTAFQIDTGAATNLHYVGLPGGTAAAGGTTTASTVVGTFNGTNPGGTTKSAWAYKLNDMAGSYNGGAVVPDATGAMPTGLTTVRLGKLVAATMWSGYLRKISYYAERIDNAGLVTLTT